MKRASLEAIAAAHRARRAIVLLSRLDGAAETLWSPGAPLPEGPLGAAVSRALATDDAFVVEPGDGLEHRTFVQPFNPPLRLVLVGAVHIAEALARLGQVAGYEVTIVDPRQAFAAREPFAGYTVVTEWPDEALEVMALDHRVAVVTLTHDPKLDDPALEVALRSPAFYIGALGSSKTHAQRHRRLSAKGFSTEQLARIHGPVGLKIGARTPAEVAVSALAEITARLRLGSPPP